MMKHFEKQENEEKLYFPESVQACGVSIYIERRGDNCGK